MKASSSSGINKIILAAELVIILMALVSVFLPYVHRINIITSDPSIARTSSGWDFPLAYVSIGIMGASLFLNAIRKYSILILFMSTLNLGIMLLLRMFIHSTMNIDDVYDTQTGIGFHLLVAAGIVMFKLSLIHYLLNRNTNSIPINRVDLLDS